MTKHVLVQDNDAHWYVIPENMRSEWTAWCDIPSDDERSWNVPDFAEAVGGAPSLVVFGDYAIR